MIGVIADDLTGAAEIGAFGLRCGLSSQVVLDHAEIPAADLVCVDTDSRFCAPEEAALRVKNAAGALLKAGAKWLYKKTDSVLRGNVPAEVGAVMEAAGAKSAILIPANPSMQRIVVGGKYFLQGRPLHETEFGKDPGHPRKSHDVLELLSGNGGWKVTSGAHGAEIPLDGILVGDAQNREDLERWARRAGQGMATAGAAEFFAALLSERGHVENTGLMAHSLRAGEGAVFVCGSMSESSRKFISAMRESGRGDAVISLPDSLAQGARFSEEAKSLLTTRAVAAYEKSKRLILCVGLPLVRDEWVARTLSGHLVELASMVLSRLEVKYVFAEGGATAVALARRQGWTRLKVAGEMSRGVVAMEAGGPGGKMLVIKPGSYEWPRF